MDEDEIQNEGVCSSYDDAALDGNGYKYYWEN